MKNRIKNHRVAVVCALVAAFIAVPAANAGVTTEYSLDLASAYVWRGYGVTDGAVFQPSVTSAHDSGFSLNIWGNVDISDVNGFEGEFLEVDITLSYAFPSSGSFSAEVGMIEYLFPNGDGVLFGAASTTELYVSFGWDVMLSPAINLYYDIDQVEDFYGDVGISWSKEVGTDTSLDIGVTVAYAGEDFAAFYGGGSDGGFHNGLLTVGVGYAPADKWAFGGYVAYSDSLDKDVLPTQPVDFFAGLSLSRSF